MNIVRKKAEEIFRREHPSVYRHPYPPFYAPPRLDNLWPCDQQKYIDRAERELGLTDSN